MALAFVIVKLRSFEIYKSPGILSLSCRVFDIIPDLFTFNFTSVFDIIPDLFTINFISVFDIIPDLINFTSDIDINPCQFSISFWVYFQDYLNIIVGLL